MSSARRLSRNPCFIAPQLTPGEVKSEPTPGEVKSEPAEADLALDHRVVPLENN
jgi:hypothetical protein